MKSKKGFIKSAFAALLVTILMVFVMPGNVRAAETGYNYYRVQPGDYLWLIGWKFETTVDALKEANSLNTTYLVPNQVLRIPAPAGFVRELPQAVTYTVRSGDSLYLISQRFGVSMQSLIDGNELSPSEIYPGQDINISLTPQQRYTVKAGDSLYLIAQKYNANIELLKLVNKMNSTALWVGQVLFVPAGSPAPETPAPEVPQKGQEIPYGGQWGQVPQGTIMYKVQAGDTLWGIANRFKSSISAIKVSNHLHSELININQPLFIPQNSTQPVSIPYPVAEKKEGYGELMDWQYVYWVLDNGNTAVLKDLTTGMTFRAKRLGGSNHADMEPLTAADTAIMKQIYGGQWSWERRAVLVEVDGKIIAGSMAGMPHDIQTITDNGFTGHFDLHFLNSRTHNTNSIDPEHQKMVQKAAGN